MTSKQVLLILMSLLLAGCSLVETPAEPLVGPYAQRRVWAVAPLRNESGSQQADGVVMADHLHRQLANAANLDLLPVNRTMAAMNALRIAQIESPSQAVELMRTLGADGLVIGTITAYDPYDPPKLGLTLELYVQQPSDRPPAENLRRLASAATEASVSLPDAAIRPAVLTSSVLDASDPSVREQMRRYAVQRGADPEATGWRRVMDEGLFTESRAWRRYRISMDLYSEFAGYVMSWRLLDAERRRVTPLTPTIPPASTSGATSQGQSALPTGPTSSD